MAASTAFISTVLMSIVPLAAVGLGFVALMIWLRQRAMVRRAAVSEQSPGCTACLYIVRGWNSFRRQTSNRASTFSISAAAQAHSPCS